VIRIKAWNIPDMSVNLFNRPKLGLGPGSIEILDLSHVSMRNRTRERKDRCGAPFSGHPLGEPLNLQ
jgi:hypothetical protein